MLPAALGHGNLFQCRSYGIYPTLRYGARDRFSVGPTPP